MFKTMQPRNTGPLIRASPSAGSVSGTSPTVYNGGHAIPAGSSPDAYEHGGSPLVMSPRECDEAQSDSNEHSPRPGSEGDASTSPLPAGKYASNLSKSPLQQRFPASAAPNAPALGLDDNSNNAPRVLISPHPADPNGARPNSLMWRASPTSNDGRIRVTPRAGEQPTSSRGRGSFSGYDVGRGSAPGMPSSKVAPKHTILAK